MSKLRRAVRPILWFGAIAGLLVAALGLVRWMRDAAEIREIVGSAVSEEAPPSVRMREALKFMVDHVGYVPEEDYFLVAPLEFLKPTALQVIRGTGGDCAYRARAFIVLLHEKGVCASKLAIYDARGRPVHAVARVETERGDYVVDLLFNIIHEDDAGNPIPLERLMDTKVLEESILRSAAGGNPRAPKYPVAQYAYHEVRTINWDKAVVMKLLFRMLSALMGEKEARQLPRPYLSEEPALMVAAGGGTGSGFCFLFLGVGSWRRRRRLRLAGA